MPPFMTDTDEMTAREALWQMFDDFDSFNDEAKGDDAAFRRWTTELAKRRFDIATSDGYTLAWLRD